MPIIRGDQYKHLNLDDVYIIVYTIIKTLSDTNMCNSESKKINSEYDMVLLLDFH